jgi:type II secretion system protein I
MRKGFTLLEALVATLVMAIAVSGLLAALSTSLHNAGRLTEHDRAVMLAHQKMDELLIAARLPKMTPFEGTWDASLTAGVDTRWRALVTPYEKPPNAGPGTPVLERVQLEVYWMQGAQRRSFALEGFRRAVLEVKPPL